MPEKPRTYRRTFIREWRKSRENMTLKRLADRIGMAQSSLLRIERGEQPYSQPILEAIAEAIGCEPADLVGRLPGAPRELTVLVNKDTARPDRNGQVRPQSPHQIGLTKPPA